MIRQKRKNLSVKAWLHIFMGGMALSVIAGAFIVIKALSDYEMDRSIGERMLTFENVLADDREIAHGFGALRPKLLSRDGEEGMEDKRAALLPLIAKGKRPSKAFEGWEKEVTKNIELEESVVNELLALQSSKKAWDNKTVANFRQKWEAYKNRYIKSASENRRLPAMVSFFTSNEVQELASSAAEVTDFAKNEGVKSLEQIKITVIASAIASFIIAIIIILSVRHKILAPLNRAVDGFRACAAGDYSKRVKVEREDEIGRMIRSFNTLVSSIDVSFRVSHKIGKGVSMGEAFRLLKIEMGELASVDWIGLIIADKQNVEGMMLDRFEGDPLDGLELGRIVSKNGSSKEWAGLTDRLKGAGMKSILILPMAPGDSIQSRLVIASKMDKAYSRGISELFANLAFAAGRIMEKTMVTDSLVVAAVEGLAKLAESRDNETGGHLERMALYSAIIANEMNASGKMKGKLSQEWIRDLHRFAPMHDIGKVSVSDAVLLKKGPLTDEEREDMCRHPIAGGDVLRKCEEQMEAHGKSIFRLGIEIAEGHHEKWDGSGYPRGLSNDEIPLSARIVSVADVFDALTSKRPYKKAWTVEEAIVEIESLSSKSFDPEIVAAMSRALPEMMKVYDKHKHV